MTERKMPRAIQNLRGALADETAAADLVGRFFDHAVAQPLSTYVVPEYVLTHLDRLLDERVTEPWVKNHLRAWFDRDLARAEERGDTVGDWISPEARTELRALAARPVQMDRRFLEKLVQQGAIKHMLRSIVEETLDRFVSTFKPGGTGGGFAGGVARGVFGAASKASGGLLGSVAGQIEQQLRAAVSSFVQGSMSMMLDRLVVILSSQETANQLARMKLNGFDEAMKRPTAKVAQGVQRLPLDDLLEVLPGQLVHNLRRDEVRAALREDVALWLEAEGARPVRDLAADEAALLAWRAEVVAIATPVLVGFAAAEPFVEWLAAHG